MRNQSRGVDSNHLQPAGTELALETHKEPGLPARWRVRSVRDGLQEHEKDCRRIFRTEMKRTTANLWEHKIGNRCGESLLAATKEAEEDGRRQAHGGTEGCDYVGL